MVYGLGPQEFNADMMRQIRMGIPIIFVIRGTMRSK